MAVYYKWIKGCASGANLSEGLWTYIKWGSGNASLSVNNLPTLYTTNGKVDTPDEDRNLGYFLTNNATGVQLQQPWILGDNCYFKTGTNNIFVEHDDAGSIKMYSDTSGGYYSFTKGLNVDEDTSLQGALTVAGKTIITDATEASDADAALKISGGVRVNKSLNVGNKLDVKEGITSKSSCTAVYFNATSDMRAKENIRLATYDALALIEKLPVYIYNYKNDKDTVTGILAQDLLALQPQELQLVSNIHATGENEDYMSIKHDKIIFILMKAIQEQQEQINYLKKEIKQLKNK